MTVGNEGVELVYGMVELATASWADDELATMNICAQLGEDPRGAVGYDKAVADRMILPGARRFSPEITEGLLRATTGRRRLMCHIDPRIQVRHVKMRDARSRIAKLVDESDLTSTEQLMVLGEVTASYAKWLVEEEHGEVYPPGEDDGSGAEPAVHLEADAALYQDMARLAEATSGQNWAARSDMPGYAPGLWHVTVDGESAFVVGHGARGEALARGIAALVNAHLTALPSREKRAGLRP